MSQHAYCIAAIAVVLVAFIYTARRAGMLPALDGRAGFVGAYGRSPGMTGCMAFNDPGTDRSMQFNRCTYV